jgi:hypothetical protein
MSPLGLSTWRGEDSVREVDGLRSLILGIQLTAQENKDLF